MIKTIIVLLNFAFKCSLVNETSAASLVQAGNQANQLASVIDCTGNITHFTESCISKFLFFWRLKRDVFFNFCVCHKKDVSGKHHICEQNTWQNWENKLLMAHFFYLICIKLVNIKSKTILSACFIRYSIKARRKKLFKKMDSSKKTTIKLSRKIDLRGF